MPTIYNMSKPYLKQLWNNMCNTCSYIVQAYSTHVIPRHVQRACIYACMIMHACMACMHSCMQACVHTLIHTSHEPISMHACMHGCRQSCMHACMHACLHAHVHVCTTHDPTFFFYFFQIKIKEQIYVRQPSQFLSNLGGGGTCMHACMHLCMIACIHRPCAYASIHPCIRVHQWMYVYACIDMHASTCIHLMIATKLPLERKRCSNTPSEFAEPL